MYNQKTDVRATDMKRRSCHS